MFGGPIRGLVKTLASDGSPRTADALARASSKDNFAPDGDGGAISIDGSIKVVAPAPFEPDPVGELQTFEMWGELMGGACAVNWATCGDFTGAGSMWALQIMTFWY